VRRGIRLWIDDKLVIDRWNNEAPLHGVSGQCHGNNQECSTGEVLFCKNNNAHSVIQSIPGRKVRSLISNSCPAYNQSVSTSEQFYRAIVQYWNLEMPQNPMMSQIPTHVAKTGRSAVGVIGFAVNGVPFYGPMDDFSSPRKWGEEQWMFDDCNGHVDSLGIYHYHGNPTCLYGTDLLGHSPLIGFMLDGIPIYGPLDVGGIKARDLAGTLKLDECGGHVDTENTFYHYHSGSEQSHIVNCLRGCLQGTVYNGSNVNINSLSPCISSSAQYDYTSLSAFSVSKLGTIPSTMRSGSSLRTHSGQAYLEVGSFHKIKVEYVHHAGYAAMHLSWSLGVGARQIATEFFQSNPVKWCGDTILCSGYILTVQAGTASAAQSTVSPLDNMKLDVVQPVLDDSYATALATLPKYSQPNYISEAGDLVFTVTSRDKIGNVRVGGEDSFTLKILRHVLIGTAQEASTSSIILATNSSSQDGAYNGHFLDITEGSGSGQRVSVQNYFGETRQVVATFASAPDSSSRYIVGVEEEVSIQALGNGYFMARPQLTISSNYTLWVQLGGTTHIDGSPFHVYVGASKFSAADSYVKVNYAWEAGEAETLYIIARDKFGNNVTESSFSDSCKKKCSAFRFSTVIRSSISMSLVNQGQIAAAGSAMHFTMASTSSAFPGQYVGYAVNVGGETRNITHHGNAASSSADQGRVITVDASFSTAPGLGEDYYITRVLALKVRSMRICRMSEPDGHSPAGVNSLAMCPAILETGEYTIDIKFAGRHLSNSPVRVLVRPSWKCASKSTATGMGLTLATAGLAATFTITTKDSFSQLSINGGDGFAVSADRGGAIKNWQYFSYCAPTLTQCSVSSTGLETQLISDQNTGTYLVSFLPTRSGDYRINVKLGLFADLAGSPYRLIVKPGSFCATKSYARGIGLTLATSGLQSRFTVFAQDSYNNPVEYLNPSAIEALTVTVGSSVTKVLPRDSGIDVHPAEDPASGWDVAYTVDKTFATRNYTLTLDVNGNYISNIVSGGLFATYYSASGNQALTVPVAIKEDRQVDFSGDGVGHTAGVNALVDNWPWKGLKRLSTSSVIYANSQFSARWTGLIEPLYNQTYTFNLMVNGAHERARMWVDNSLIMNQWESLASLYPTGTYRFDKDFALYDVKIEFVENGNARRLSLLWETNSAGGNSVPVPSNKLWRVTQSFTTLVIPQNRPAVALFSTASGDALSLATVGSYSYFTVTARDVLKTIEKVDSQKFKFAFQGRTGREVGGLSATYFQDTELSSHFRSLPVKTISYLIKSTALTREIAMPTPADKARVVQVADAVTLGASVGSDILIDDEIMRVISINSNSITVVRGQAGTAVARHVNGAKVNTVPVNGLNFRLGYSARYEGLVRPQYDELYTWTVNNTEADERVKLWIDDVLLIDQWTSIAGTSLSATWPSPSANGFYSIKMEYKEHYGKREHENGIEYFTRSGKTLTWNSASQGGPWWTQVVPSDRLYMGNAVLHSEIVSIGDGRYRGRYLTTLSGLYQTKLTLNTAGGLAATYYADTQCQKYAYHRMDAEVNFDWGNLSPHQSVPRDYFCVRWTGMLAPINTEVHKFVMTADDSAKLWIDHELLIDHMVSDGESWATRMLRKDFLYPVTIEYREQQHTAKIKLLWSTGSLVKTSISGIEFRENSCSQRPDNLLVTCLSASTGGVSGGTNFINGNIIVYGGKPSAIGTFTVDSKGSILSVTLSQGGSGYEESVGIKDVDLLYNDTNTSQILTVTSIKIMNGGSGYHSGRFRVLSGNSSDLARGDFVVDSAGKISKLTFSSHGSGYSKHIDASAVEILFATNLENEEPAVAGKVQAGTINAVQISGTKTTNYASDSDMSVTCSAPCTGAGFKAKCSVREGSVVNVKVINYGTGYKASNPPSLICPGGAGQTFTPVIANGAILMPKVALGARLKPLLAGNATKVVPASNLFGVNEPIKGWEGSKDFHTLDVKPHVLCGSTSSIQGGGSGWAASLSTVGFPATFTIIARDQYGNIRTGTESTPESDFFVSRLVWNESSVERIYSGTSSTDAGTITTSVVPGRYDFSVLSSAQTTAGYRLMQTSLITQGGLSATYYTGANYTMVKLDEFRYPAVGTPAKGQKDSTIDFSGVSKTWPACLAGNIQYPFNVRWSGFVRQTTGSSASYTFSFALKHSEERVRLWLSNSLVIDQWASLAGLSPSMSTAATLDSNAHNSILVDYKSKDETRGITMNWRDSSGVLSVVPSSRLFANYDVVDGYRLEYVQGGSAEDQGKILLTGHAVSLTTAYSHATFTITARDRYENAITSALEFVVRFSHAQAEAQKGFSALSNPGTFAASYRVTRMATQTLTVSLPLFGGLHATYFTSNDFTSGKYIRTESLSPKFGSGDATGEEVWPGMPGESMTGQAFSVRWEGFLKPSLPARYQFKASVADMDDRIKLWLDNSLIIEQWQSLDSLSPTGTFHFTMPGTLFDVKIEYKEATGLHGMSLTWNTVPISTVIIDDLGCNTGCYNSSSAVVMRNLWAREAIVAGFFGTGYHHDGNSGKGVKQFQFVYPEALGVYDVYLYYPSSVTFDSKVPISVIHTGGSSLHYVDFSVSHAAGGKFLGRYSFINGGIVLISNAGTTMLVVADAAKFVSTTLPSDRVLHCGKVLRALNAREFLIVRSDLFTNTDANYLNAYMQIGNERGLIIKSVNAEKLTLDRSFSLGSSTLSTLISDSATSLDVANAADAGIIVGRMIEIDNEVMLVSSVSSNSVTVVRAYMSTKAIAHESGVTVKTILMPGKHHVHVIKVLPFACLCVCPVIQALPWAYESEGNKARKNGKGSCIK
jgi:hypothetical protein